MKYRILLLSILLIIYNIILLSQTATVTGNLVDENGDAYQKVSVKLYIGSDIYETISLEDGTFTFNNVTDVDQEMLEKKLVSLNIRGK